MRIHFFKGANAVLLKDSKTLVGTANGLLAMVNIQDLLSVKKTIQYRFDEEVELMNKFEQTKLVFNEA